MLGDAYVDRTWERTTELTAGIQELITSLGRDLDAVRPEPRTGARITLTAAIPRPDQRRPLVTVGLRLPGSARLSARRALGLRPVVALAGQPWRECRPLTALVAGGHLEELAIHVQGAT